MGFSHGRHRKRGGTNGTDDCVNSVPRRINPGDLVGAKFNRIKRSRKPQDGWMPENLQARKRRGE